MRNGKKRKGSLTQSLTFRMAVLLITMFLLTSLCCYHTVAGLVNEQEKIYCEAVANNFLDSVCAQAAERGIPVDERSASIIDTLGRKLCNRNVVSYVFTYVVCPEENKVMVLGVSAQNESMGEIKELKKKRLQELDYPNDDSFELWISGLSDSGIKDKKNETICAVCSQQDSFGNIVKAGAAITVKAMDDDTNEDFKPLILIIIVMFFVLMLCIYLIMKSKVLRPAKRIGQFMTAYIKDGKRTENKLEECGSYEFDLIALSLNEMIDELDSYVENIKELNEAQASHKAELDIASSIQQGFLSPGRFRAANCEIAAMMTPAKNVGGDLYDYMVLDDGRIFVSIADVSGKGIAASMYMAVTLVFMKQYASAGNSPAQILRETNNIIARNNKGMLFATAFIGIYNPETREFVYSNAGHLPPYIISNKAKPLTSIQNLVLGLYPDEQYEEEKIRLDYGDIVFLYTDGVTEAINENKKFFGEKRLENIINEYVVSDEKNIVKYVYNDVVDFMGKAEQFDDITMLACVVKHRTTLELKPDTKEFAKIKNQILESELDHSMKLSLCVVAEEIFVNICSYAFEKFESDKEPFIKFTFEHSNRILIKFEDNGIPYDPTTNVDMDVDYDPDEQLGGLGRIIAFNIADSVGYKYENDINKLVIIKNLKED
ncbi:MAG: SpoIIE family protein phosphatase [Lachnospiraceae bacterium]|nr:SpoIIE family protein phosphatase [Candidatus Colinaster equi]